MNRPLFSHRLTVMLSAFFALVFTAGIAAAQSSSQLESELSSLSGPMSEASHSASCENEYSRPCDEQAGRDDEPNWRRMDHTSGHRADQALPGGHRVAPVSLSLRPFLFELCH